tara:strand:+ start:1681 stop:2307 length:627 start_codon:yes stop_codon:yes gene_type:complete
MANHVYFNIQLSLDDGETALVQKLSKKVEYMEGSGDFKYKSYDLSLLPIYPTPYEEDNWYAWGCDNMGAKWVNCEEFEDTYITGYSAWSPPIPLVENLVQYIYDQVGGKVSAEMTYEDEFRNFIGKGEFWIEAGNVYHDIDECEGEDLNQLMLEAYGKDDDWFQSDEFDWWEEYPVVKGSLKGENMEAQTYVDELVYDFFDKGRLELL